MKKVFLTIATTLISTQVSYYLPANALPYHTDIISQVSGDDTVIIQKSRLGRAQNLARQAAENANGGLTKYRAESSMFGNPQDAPFRDNGNGSWTFTFKGGAPNYNPTIETSVTIPYDFSRVIVDYNGPIRN